MRLISLQSGSSGNCIFVESEGVRILFDAGLSASEASERLAVHGRNAEAADALFISHDHYDHVRCAGVYARKFGIPLFITEKTYDASKRAIKPNREMDVEHFKSGASVKIGHLTVESVGTPHDARDGVVFVVDDGRHRLGICTDVGHVYKGLRDLVAGVDALFLESNYDETMLARGPYPQSLKRRISGAGGHISNREAADLVAKHASPRLQWLCLAHLSDKNNTVQKALAAHREALGEEMRIQVASRYKATEVMVVDTENVGSSLHRQLSLPF